MNDIQNHPSECEWTAFFIAYSTGRAIGRKWNLCTPHIELQVRYADSLPPYPKEEK